MVKIIGVGYETALEFAKRGARVIIACQSYGKGKIIQQKMIAETCSQTVVVKILDLLSFDSIRAFADEINRTEKRLDILINNPSVNHFRNKKTKSEYVDVMQINYFSSFLLTNLLLGNLLIFLLILLICFGLRFNDKNRRCSNRKHFFYYTTVCFFVQSKNDW